MNIFNAFYTYIHSQLLFVCSSSYGTCLRCNYKRIRFVRDISVKMSRFKKYFIYHQSVSFNSSSVLYSDKVRTQSNVYKNKVKKIKKTSFCSYNNNVFFTVMDNVYLVRVKLRRRLLHLITASINELLR